MILNETKIVETSTKSQFVLIRKCFIILLVLVLLSVFIGSINFANNFDFRPIQIIESIKLSFYSEHERIVQKNQNKFIQNHNDIVTLKKKPIKVSINGINHAGYANRLYSMLTSFVIAIITDSALIIRWNHISKYIKEPFNLTFNDFSKQNNELNVDYNSSEFFQPQTAFPWQKTKNMDILIKTQIPINRTRFFYNSIDPLFFELCSNPNYYEKFYNFGLIRLETMEKALNVTKNMSLYSPDEKSNSILMIPFEVGGNLLNKFWIPNDEIMKNVNHYVENVFKDYFVIGIQLRYQYLVDSIDTNSFLKCALEIEKNLTMNNNSNDNDSFSKKYKGFKWYLSSDSSNVLDRLKKIYQNKIILGTGRMGHVESDSNAYPRAILDIELLSRCNELIMTGGSTFCKF